MIIEVSQRLDLGQQLGQPEMDPLVVDERLAEGFAVRGSRRWSGARSSPSRPMPSACPPAVPAGTGAFAG